MKLYYVSPNTRLYSWMKKMNKDCISRLWDLANDALSVVLDSYFLEKNMKNKAGFVSEDDIDWDSVSMNETERGKIVRAFMNNILSCSAMKLISESRMNEIIGNLDEEFFRIAGLHIMIDNLDSKITDAETATALEKRLFADSRKDLDEILGFVNAS